MLMFINIVNFFLIKIRIGFYAYPHSVLCLCIFLHLYRQSRAKLESVFKDGCFGEAHVLDPAIVELFEGFLLLVREALFEFLVMPCHVAEEFLHLR